MVFSLIDDVIKSTSSVVEDAIDVGTAVITLGEHGDFNKKNVSRLIASGLTVYAIAELASVTVDAVEKVLED